MISVEHRHTLGFRDEFEGYVFLKDDIPFAQLHLYNDYHTFFWLGAADPQKLGECLGQTVMDVTNQFGLYFHSMNTGSLCIASKGAVEKFSFAIVNPEAEVGLQLRVGDGGDDLEYFLSKQAPISFCRFDVDSSKRMPLILWADAGKSEYAEVGFSSLIDLPSSVLTLIRSTSRIELTAEELSDISGQISMRMPVGAGLM
jgi:hypothetical protein